MLSGNELKEKIDNKNLSGKYKTYSWKLGAKASKANKVLCLLLSVDPTVLIWS